jgi:hypothetical protein
MPVLDAIQSSLVSTSFSRSVLVSTASGTLLPDPASLQPACRRRVVGVARILLRPKWFSTYFFSLEPQVSVVETDLADFALLLALSQW